MLSVVENGLDPRAAIPVGSRRGSRVGKGHGTAMSLVFLTLK